MSPSWLVSLWPQGHALGVAACPGSSPVLPQLGAALPPLIINHPYRVAGSRTHTGTVVPHLSRVGAMLEAAGLGPAHSRCNGPASQQTPVLGSCPCPCCPLLALLPQKTHQALHASLGWVRCVPACAGGRCLMWLVLAEDMCLETPVQAICRALQGWCQLGGVRGRCLGPADAEGSLEWVQSMLDACRAASGQGGTDPAAMLALSHSPCCVLVHCS